MESIVEPRTLFRASPWFYALLALASVVAFWPGYLAVPPDSLSAYHHVHALTASAWLALLIVQPALALSGRLRLHRSLGRLSYLLMPAVLLSFVALAHAMMQGTTGMDQEIQVFLAYVRLVGGATLAGFWMLAVAYRRDTPLHARLMLCTGLTLIEPVANRIGLRVLQDWSFNYQYLSFGLMAAVLLSCIWTERHAVRGRWVFPSALAALLLVYLPLLLRFYQWPSYDLWRRSALWFGNLPLT